MQGRKDIQPKMMYQINMDMLVPSGNFYRKLSQKLDLFFLYIHSQVLWQGRRSEYGSRYRKELMKFNRPKHGIIAKALQNINVKAGEFLLYLKGL